MFCLVFILQLITFCVQSRSNNLDVFERKKIFEKLTVSLFISIQNMYNFICDLITNFLLKCLSH